MVMARWHACERLLGNGHDVLFDFIFDCVRVWSIWIESRIAGCVCGGQDECIGCTDIGRAPDVRSWLDEVEPSRTAEGPPPSVLEETNAQTNKQQLPHKNIHKRASAVQTNKQVHTHTNKCTRTRTHTHTHAHLRSAPLFPFAQHHMGYLGVQPLAGKPICARLAPSRTVGLSQPTTALILSLHEVLRHAETC